MAFVRWLHEGNLQRAEVGGKGASLSQLIDAGFTVPDGFCVTADGYRRFAAENGIDAEIASLLQADLSSPAALKEAAQRIEALVEAATLPPDLGSEIVAGYEELTRQLGEYCAVRSSAISEDGSAASFAGLYETYLNVKGAESVLENVRRCYQSLWSERAIQYRTRRGGGPDEAMAVVVMGLVQSETSGIAFTAHPVTGSRDCVVINASWGLGEAIVSGRVTPDMFVITKGSYDLTEREIYPKELAIRPHPDGGGTVEEPIAPERANTPSLSDEEAREVARLAERVESHYGSPQDLEWAMNGGTLYLLQSRPITTL